MTYDVYFPSAFFATTSPGNRLPHHRPATIYGRHRVFPYKRSPSVRTPVIQSGIWLSDERNWIGWSVSSHLEWCIICRLRYTVCGCARICAHGRQENNTSPVVQVDWDGTEWTSPRRRPSKTRPPCARTETGSCWVQRDCYTVRVTALCYTQPSSWNLSLYCTLYLYIYVTL